MKKTFIALAIYVDDVIIASNSEDPIKEIKSYLHKCFNYKGLEKIKVYSWFRNS